MTDKKKLQPGMLAPSFTAETWEGQSVALEQYRGHRIWLAFFRHVNCPLCNIRIHEMRDRYASLGVDKIQIIAVFQSPASRFQSNKTVAQSWYPLISDPKEELYTLYGLTTSFAGTVSLGNLPIFAQAFVQGVGSFTKIDGSVMRVPADFLVGPDGVVVDAYYGGKIGDHIPYKRVEAFLEQTQLNKPASGAV
jgi:peroxiredoxin